MPTTLLLVRHAVHDRVDRVLCGRMPGVSLAAPGRQQATRLGVMLSPNRVAAIYTSPQPRARETADPIAAACRREAALCGAIDEIDFGEWTGLAFDTLAADPRWQAWNTARAAGCPPHGESMAAAQRRVADWAATLPARHPDATVVAVSHGDVIKSALAAILGLSLDQHARFDIAPASVSAVALWPGGGKVVHVNQMLPE